MNFKTRFDEKTVNIRMEKWFKSFICVIGCVSIMSTYVSAYHATQISANVKNDGIGGYLAAVTASNDHYGKIDADKSYFIATLHNKSSNISVSSERKFFGRSETAYAVSPSAAWKYDDCTAYMEQ